MNEQLRRSDLTPTTQAADGLPRRRWTTAELARMVEAGILDPDERFELIGGEVVPMSPKGRRHEIVREEIAFILGRLASDDVRIVSEPQLNFDDDTFTLPDIVVRPAAILMPDVRGPTALLVIEVADSSLTYDLVAKAPLYARQGVREYWAVDAQTLATTVHREPAAEGYDSVRKVAPARRLVPQLSPALGLRLKDLGV